MKKNISLLYKAFGEDYLYLNINFTKVRASYFQVDDETLGLDDFKSFLKPNLIRGFLDLNEFEKYIHRKSYLYPLFNVNKISKSDILMYSKESLFDFLKLSLRDNPKSSQIIDYLNKILLNVQYVYFLDPDNVSLDSLRYNEGQYSIYFLIFWIEKNMVNIIEIFED